MIIIKCTWRFSGVLQVGWRYKQLRWIQYQQTKLALMHLKWAFNSPNQQQQLFSPSLNFITYPFKVLKNPTVGSMLHESAADCICVILQVLEERCARNNIRETDEQLQQLQLWLFSCVMDLTEPYHWTVEHEDADKWAPTIHNIHANTIITSIANKTIALINYLQNNELLSHLHWASWMFLTNNGERLVERRGAFLGEDIGPRAHLRQSPRLRGLLP